jgi:hypothetical protein
MQLVPGEKQHRALEGGEVMGLNSLLHGGVDSLKRGEYARAPKRTGHELGLDDLE